MADGDCGVAALVQHPETNGLADTTEAPLPPPPPIVNPVLFEFECKKKSPLAHEFGAGSRCLRCKENCPGLELHYWRKICLQCRCRKDDHDLPVQKQDPAELRIGRLFEKPPAAVAGGCAAAGDAGNCVVKKEIHVTSEEIGELRANASEMTVTTPTTEVTPRQVFASRFEWIPPKTTAKSAELYMNLLPAERRPIVDSEGAANRRRAFERQLPLYDIEASACHELSADELKNMTKYTEYLQRNVVGQGLIKEAASATPTTITTTGTAAAPVDDAVKQDDEAVETVAAASSTTPAVALATSAWSCAYCKNTINVDEVAVVAERLKPNEYWHPGCFVCDTCHELLVDMIYFVKDGHVLCGRHFGETIFPRCAACDELIFAKEYTQAEDKAWHLKHFCCFHCDSPLAGHRYMYRQDQPYCLACYEQLFAKTCAACGQKIAADVNRVSYDQLHWHAVPDCFRCSSCKKCLLEQRFIFRGDQVYCSAECARK